MFLKSSRSVVQPKYSGLWQDSRVLFGQQSYQTLPKTLASAPLRHDFGPGAMVVPYSLTNFRVKGHQRSRGLRRRPEVQFNISPADSGDSQRCKILKYKYQEFRDIILKNVYNNIYRCYCNIQKVPLCLGIQLLLSHEHIKSRIPSFFTTHNFVFITQ